MASQEAGDHIQNRTLYFPVAGNGLAHALVMRGYVLGPMDDPERAGADRGFRWNGRQVGE